MIRINSHNPQPFCKLRLKVDSSVVDSLSVHACAVKDCNAEIAKESGRTHSVEINKIPYSRHDKQPAHHWPWHYYAISQKLGRHFEAK